MSDDRLQDFTGKEMDTNVYQEAAQHCLDYHGLQRHEFGRFDHKSFDTAQELYEEHGHFDLRWGGYPFDGESASWYDDTQ